MKTELQIELEKEMESKEFRYSSRGTGNTRHGLNITDVKKIVNKGIKKTKKETLKKVNIEIDNFFTDLNKAGSKVEFFVLDELKKKLDASGVKSE